MMVNLHDLVLDRDFLDITPKVIAIREKKWINWTPKLKRILEKAKNNPPNGRKNLQFW